MPKPTQSTPPDWMEEENQRAKTQRGKPVNKSFDKTTTARKKPEAAPKIEAVQVQRVTKGFQVEVSRVRKWDQLVAALKNSPSNKRTGPELIDEAIDYLCKKYDKDLAL